MMLRGFYAVLDRDDEALVRSLLSAGPCALQVRLKPGTARMQLALARMARSLCDKAGVPLIINDRIDIALACGADGVHLGQTDLPIAAARALASSLRVGVSTHDVEQVRVAVAAGADYLGFGPVFVTQTKQNPAPVQGLAGLRAAVVAAGATPIVAIGGIAPRNAAEVYATGASAICAIQSVNDAADVAAAARSLHSLS